VRIVVPDLGLSNLWSAGRALEVLGHEPVPTRDPETVAAADFLLLPGVGAFGVAASRLAKTGIGEAIRAAADRGGRVLGICLGMQLLFESSEEGGGSRGLGLLPGNVARLSGDARVPHIGWNRVIATERGASLFGNGAGADFYFVHSFAARPSSEDVVLARCCHGESFPAAVRQGAFLGFQFHPEKSGEAGVRLLGRAIASLSETNP
jgi:glutamine amidotransferase